MEEIWKEIEGYEGLYEVSNMGAIRSIPRYVDRMNNGTMTRHFYKQVVLKPKQEKNGYLRVTLTKEGKKHSYGLHRLVALTFIPNPQNLEQVNHKDENKTNNHIGNLEWCSALYNTNYGTGRQRSTETFLNNEWKGKITHPSRQKKVYKIDPVTMEVVAEYCSTIEAAKQNNVTRGMICCACNGKRKSAVGHLWRYAI